MGKKIIPIGIDNFKELREKACYFIDKSEIIKDMLTRKIYLATRPRRFGKTLNLDMMRYFFDNGVSTCDDFEKRIEGKLQVDNKYLFDGLKISEDTEIMKHQGKYPVIFISFKEIKESKWEDCYEAIKTIMKKIYSENEYVLKYTYDSEKITYEKLKSGTPTKIELEQSLKNIMQYFYRYFKQKTILIIDEYDQPIISGYCNGYYTEIVEVIRNMLSAALKTNDYLEKGILTGVTRVAKESIFSGLNNLKVDSVIVPLNSDKFGFTEDEVKEILKYYEKEGQYNQVKTWYNGYKINKEKIYNPWSVLNYASDPDNRLISYWVNTGSDEMIRTMLKDNFDKTITTLNGIIQGNEVTREIDEAVNYKNINVDDIWSIMLHSGYITVSNPEIIGKGPDGDGIIRVNLEIPNREIKSTYDSIISTWLSETVGTNIVEDMLKELTEGKIEEFAKRFKKVVLESMSTYDPQGKESEKYYHIFCLGLFVKLKSKYYVKSEMESGLGRSDVILIPKDKTKRGIIIEFKKVDEDEKETLEKATEAALKQIEEKKYDVVLKENEVREILKIGAGFKGKDCLMKWVQ